MGTQGEIIRGVLSYSHPAGSVAQNVFTWELQDEDSTDANILDAIDDWVVNDWGPDWVQTANNDVLLYLLEVDVLNNDGTVKRNIGEEIQAKVGSIAGDVTAAAVSGFIQMSTERAKSFARKYTPGLSETHITDGRLDASALAVLVLLLADTTMNIPVTTSGILKAGVLSRVTNLFLETDGGGYATTVPAYQRRRKPGVGS